ncbi:hypothetical protein CCB80_07355 [Armatimonadetes bacterium Uphvl-Ar1]|nr:hypothetical protein CCB80_07355 [Armatimonadetes bacterium Uphvl-Ar1]
MTPYFKVAGCASCFLLLIFVGCSPSSEPSVEISSEAVSRLEKSQGHQGNLADLRAKVDRRKRFSVSDTEQWKRVMLEHDSEAQIKASFIGLSATIHELIDQREATDSFRKGILDSQTGVHRGILLLNYYVVIFGDVEQVSGSQKARDQVRATKIIEDQLSSQEKEYLSSIPDEMTDYSYPFHLLVSKTGLTGSDRTYCENWFRSRNFSNEPELRKFNEFVKKVFDKHNPK